MKFSKLLLAGAAALAFSGSADAAVTYSYVGYWSVADGPAWSDNPIVYSAQEAAALLFGGSASDYAISTLGEDVNTINFSAHVDGWGDPTYLYNGGLVVAQDYKLDLGAPGYDDPSGTGSAYSAYVSDHSSPGDVNTRNYAFRISGAVPEPASWAMMIAGLAVTGASMRRRKMSVSFA